MMSCWVRRCASPVSIKEGFPAGDGDVAGQHLEGGSFTGPVDSQQPETLVDTTAGVSYGRRLQAVYARLRCLLLLRCLTETELYIWLYTNTTAAKPTAWANTDSRRRSLHNKQALLACASVPRCPSEGMQRGVSAAERRGHVTSTVFAHQYLIPVIRLIPACL